MPKQETSASIQFDITKGFKDIGQALREASTKEKLKEILQAYASLNRELLVEKGAILELDLQSLLSYDAANVLITLISTGKPGLDAALKRCESEEDRRIIESFVLPFIPFYEGYDTRYLHDWYRINWRNFYDIDAKIGVITVTILKRNGERFELQMPLNTISSLAKHLISQIARSTEVNKDQAIADVVVKELAEAKESIERAIANLSKSSK